jgi:uncharacterized oxidoreductase
MKEKHTMKMTGNTILMTGGGSGIGRAMAEAFQKLGNQVIISGRTQKKLNEVTAANPGMKFLTLDIADAGSIQAFAAQLTEQFPALNVLVNMAGVMKNEHLQDPSAVSIAEDTVATNLLGPIRLTAALLPLLMQQSSATVMTVTSGLASVPLFMTPTYCATKAAIHSYTQSLRYQLKDTSVQVIELVPPYVQTELMGERQASDPNAMPLADYMSETMSLLTNSPEATEILVDRVKPQRTAERSGSYDAFYQKFNDTAAKVRSAEWKS